MNKWVNFVEKIHIYIQTLKYIKISQIYWRLRRKIIKKPHLKSIQVFSRIIYAETWIKPILKRSSLISINPWKFNFLNQEGDLEKGWNNQNKSKLWLYNLHYHDILLSDIDLEIKKSFISIWIKENSPQEGNGWEPYPLSLRIVNWVKFYLSYQVAPEGFWESLRLQTQSLMNQLEFHLLGNHLFENAKALIFSVSLLGGVATKKWQKKGFSILQSQLDEQILEDGGHFERSPMYHSIILEGILDLINLSSISDFPIEIKDHLIKISHKMFIWLESMIHPDGQISFFNDSTLGISSTFEELLSYAERLKLSQPRNKLLFSFMKNSQFIMARKEKVYLVADVGSVSPNYLPGHAHAETLSFELSLHGKRLFINSGISTYENNSLRHEQRSTNAHNTLCLNSENSSHVWDSFRVAERARISNLCVEQNEKNYHFKARHDGYYKKYGVYHEREFFLQDNNLVIRDALCGDKKGLYDVEIFLHVHPSWHIIQEDTQTLSFHQNEKIVYLMLDKKSSCDLLPSHWNFEFNQYMLNQKIKIKIKPDVNVSWDMSLKW